VNRKVLSLEAAGQLRVPETDYSHVVHPTEPLQFAASISRPRFYTGYRLYGKGVHINDLQHSEVQSQYRTSPCYGRVLFEGHRAHRMGSA
jgi:hypothetical protein